jgi:hypothetical protein
LTALKIVIDTCGGGSGYLYSIKNTYFCKLPYGRGNLGGYHVMARVAVPCLFIGVGEDKSVLLLINRNLNVKRIALKYADVLLAAHTGGRYQSLIVDQVVSTLGIACLEIP